MSESHDARLKPCVRRHPWPPCVAQAVCQGRLLTTRQSYVDGVRARAMRRRPRSDSPPQIPAWMPVAIAYSRHARCTGQREQTSRADAAALGSLSRGNHHSGCAERAHSASSIHCRLVQSVAAFTVKPPVYIWAVRCPPRRRLNRTARTSLSRCPNHRRPSSLGGDVGHRSGHAVSNDGVGASCWMPSPRRRARSYALRTP